MTTRPALTLAAVLLLSVLAIAPAFAEDDAAALLEIIREDHDPAEFDRAVTALRQMDSKTQYLLEQELQALLTRYRKDLARVNRELDKLAGTPDESPKARKARLRWESKRREAGDFIASKDEFVEVFDRPMISPGAETAKELGAAAFAAFRGIEPGLKKDLKRHFKMSAKAALKLREEFFAARTASERVAVAMGLSGGGDPVRELPQFLLDLSEGKLANAAERYLRLPAGREKLRGFYAYSVAILLENRNLLGSDQAPGAAGLLSINGYRMALGLSPLVLNSKLMEAADGHSAEMKEKNYYSNDSPTPGRRTERERAALAGYRGPVTQYIHNGSSFTGALPVWLRSAIHHRLLVGTDFIEAGFGLSGPLTLVLGMGEKSTPPVLVY